MWPHEEAACARAHPIPEHAHAPVCVELLLRPTWAPPLVHFMQAWNAYFTMLTIPHCAFLHAAVTEANMGRMWPGNLAGLAYGVVLMGIKPPRSWVTSLVAAADAQLESAGQVRVPDAHASSLARVQLHLLLWPAHSCFPLP